MGLPSLLAQRVKRLPPMQETGVWSLGREDPLEKDMTTPLQYSCLENPMDGGGWWAIYIAHGVTESPIDERRSTNIKTPPHKFS